MRIKKEVVVSEEESFLAVNSWVDNIFILRQLVNKKIVRNLKTCDFCGLRKSFQLCTFKKIVWGLVVVLAVSLHA